VLLMLPSHCTHKLQPLDVSGYNSVSSHYDERARVWFNNHPGRAISEMEFSEIFSEAYGLAASVRNAVNGFRAAGIHPYDPQRFTPDDYFGCAVTDTVSSVHTEEVTITCRMQVDLRVANIKSTWPLKVSQVVSFPSCRRNFPLKSPPDFRIKVTT